MKKFTFYHQYDKMDCGLACLRMIVNYHGKKYSANEIRDLLDINQSGTSFSTLIDAADTMGLKTSLNQINFDELIGYCEYFPCILHWNQKHFVVLPPQNLNNSKYILVADPSFGKVKIDKDIFLKSWLHNQTGNALFFETTTKFIELVVPKKKKKSPINYLKQIKPYRLHLSFVIIGMVFVTVFSLLTPFLTQSIVDIGINNKDFGFIYLIFFSQLFIFLGNSVIESLRAWTILHVSSRINLSLVSKFLNKLMDIPMKYLETKSVGDITQRVYDHGRVDQFLTNTALNALFSVVNIIAFSVILFVYNITIFLIFLIGSAISVVWIMFFLKKREQLDYERFSILSDNQNILVETITGIQDLKINGDESFQLRKWEKTQVRLFKINIKSLTIGQLQNIGYTSLNQLKNIIVSFFAAISVANGEITMGMMLSISYITGQINSPINQLLNFLQSYQDSRISIDRISEIHNKEDEDSHLERNQLSKNDITTKGKRGIKLENVTFAFNRKSEKEILVNISLVIPEGKITAIVGPSGSGKTTLLKLLLKFYEPTKGRIEVGDLNLNSISSKEWRERCGVVFADGYIFSATLEENIALNDNIDVEMFNLAVKIAMVDEFAKKMPFDYNTQIGNSGQKLSSGQRQRILIARAIYKNPQYLFLDEATSALDAITEKEIHLNLLNFFPGRTVFIVAHRLSSVRHADQIIYMGDGKVKELGNHQELLELQGFYYELVKHQLN